VVKGSARALALALAVAGTGCAGPRPSAPPADAATAPLWGDEYEGLLDDADRLDADLDAAPASFAADVLLASPGDAAPVVRARAAALSFGARYRQSDAGRAGALEWSAGPLALVAGAVRPSLGEGALVADARDASSVEPRGTRGVDGLRLAPSSSTWGSSIGAGVRAALGRVRASAGAWREREDDALACAWASLDVVDRAAVYGVAAGRSRAGAGAWSLRAAGASAAAFVSAEVGLAPDGWRGVVRLVAGEAGEWRALVAAGAPAAGHDPSPASAGGRWGGAVERRARLGGEQSRFVLSSRTRRDGESAARRQRAEWQGSIGSGGTRLEAGLRASRETESVAADVLEPAAPPAVTDEVRARCALAAGDDVSASVRVEQVYRVDLVVKGSGPAGRVVGWTTRVRWRGLDARLQATAFDLAPGQLGYAGRAALPGAPTFTTLSRSGVDLSASLRVALGPGLVAGVQGGLTPTGESRVVLQAGVVW
jgi:hypothetical protein